MNVLIYSVIVLSVIGVLAAALLYFTAKKFKVEEDGRIGLIADLLPGANCGGCGFAGCRNLAENIVKSNNVKDNRCPVGGDEVAKKIAAILGLEAEKTEPKIAVVKCNGTHEATNVKANYDGVSSCFFANSLFAGEKGCRYGCLGYGDCVAACAFDSISIDETTGLPVVNEETCVGCGACVKACPRHVIELRNKGVKGRRVFVSCINCEKGAVAKQSCTNACIGCAKCVKVCKFDAITVDKNCAYIDFEKCKLCRQCVEVCPTGAIHAVNFPMKKTTDVVAENLSGENLSGEDVNASKLQ